MHTKTRIWSLLVLAIGLIAAFAVAGCGSDDSTSGSSDSTEASSGSGTIDISNAELIKEGQLLVGTDAPYPPFEIGTPESGDFSGFDKDLMDAIATDREPVTSGVDNLRTLAVAFAIYRSAAERRTIDLTEEP